MFFKVENDSVYWIFSNITQGDNQGFFHINVEKRRFVLW